MKTFEQMDEQEQEDFLRGQLASLEFLQSDSGAEFIQNKHNRKLISDWLKRNGKKWDSASVLEEAFQATKHLHLEVEPAPDEAEPQAEVVSSPVNPYARLTKADVLAMSPKDMTKKVNDRQFQDHVASLNISHADLVKAKRGRA
jgi:hypothetical protein